MLAMERVNDIRNCYKENYAWMKTDHDKRKWRSRSLSMDQGYNEGIQTRVIVHIQSICLRMCYAYVENWHSVSWNREL